MNRSRPKKLQLGGTELKRLYARKEALRIRTDSVLEIQLVLNEKVRRCIVCPLPPIHQKDGHLGDPWTGPLWDEPHSGMTLTGLVLAWNGCRDEDLRGVSDGQARQKQTTQ